jgi:predicted acetyltransferase
MATFVPRPLAEDEFASFPAVFGIAFGFQPSEKDVERWRASSELDRTLAVFDGDDVVGTAGAHSFELTVPGGRQVKAAGVTAVSVRTTHKRRGVLTALMKRQLTDVAERGEPVAILLASESVIYGRFGYGLATMHLATEIDPRHGTFARPFTDPGRRTIVDQAAAAKVLPGLFDTSRKLQPGDVNRSPTWWEQHFSELEHERQGASPKFFVVHESAKGKADGYLSYRVKDSWRQGLPNNEIRVVDIVARDRDVYAALWRHLLDIDLAGSVTAWGRPVDEPLRWLLADPRRLRTGVLADFLWARIIDVPAALGGRSYGTDGSLVLDVVDDFMGLGTGRFAVEGGPAGATCARTRKKADLALSIADLGALSLGGNAPSALAAAGRVEERTRGALARADAMFVTHPAPYCRTGF